MTVGQRIAQKRKELALSQEALGEELGVSRQSIYKWESDAALPEIDKLVVLSRLFRVSVGWLLGVEEDHAEPAAGQPAAAETADELSEAQLRMVKEIVEQYLAAQPKPKPRRKWPWLLFGFAVFIGVFGLINRLDQINQQYHRVQMTVSNVQESVNSQINGISNRVEEILKSQNDLTAEYGTEISGVNLEKNQIRFSAYAVPKTYVEGMEVKFSVDNHTGGINNAPGEEGFKQKFSATLATDLTDLITLSVTFIYPDGTHEIQVLDTYEGLFSASLPNLTIRDHYLFGEEISNGTLTLDNVFVTTLDGGATKSFEGCPAAEITSVQLGVFRNQRLLGWATPTEQPSNYHGDYSDEQFYLLPNLTIENLTENDKLHIAALVTDSYGRQFMVCDIPYIVNFDTNFDNPYLTYPSDGRYDPNPDNWIFD